MGDERYVTVCVEILGKRYYPQKVRNGNFEKGCKGNVNSEEFESKFLKEVSLA